MPKDQTICTIEEWLIIGGFLTALFLPLVAMAIQPRSLFSSDEYRTLAPFPPLALKAEAVSEFPNRFGSYFNDHFGFRGPLIRFQALIKVVGLGESASPEVILGKDGWLFFDYKRGSPGVDRPFTDEQMNSWQRVFESQQDWLAQRGIEYAIVIVPEKQSIYPEYLPESHRYLQTGSRLDQLLGYLKAHSHLHLVDLRQQFQEAKQTRRLYFRNDTHWNNAGALVASQTIISEFAKTRPAMKPLRDSDCVVKTTTRSRSDLERMLGLGGLFVEEIEQIQLRDPEFAVHQEADETTNMVVSNHRDRELPRLLAFCDSFGTGLSGFLSQDFSRAVYRVQSFVDSRSIALEHPNFVLQEMVERHLRDNPPPFQIVKP